MVYVGMIVFLSVLIISLILQIGKYITSSNSYGRNKIEETTDTQQGVSAVLFAVICNKKYLEIMLRLPYIPNFICGY